MPKINGVDFVLNLDNQPILSGDKELRICRALALILSSGKSADPLRALTLSRKLVEVEGTENVVELDAPDVKFIKEALKQDIGYTAMVIGQIEEKLQ